MKYETPEMKVLLLKAENVITSSLPIGGDAGDVDEGGNDGNTDLEGDF